MKFISADERQKEHDERGWNFMGFELGEIIKANEIWTPQRFLISSIQGLGKTTFGASFDRAILAQIEDGAGAVDCATFPDLVKTFADVESVVKALYQGDHKYKTLVVDTVDWLEPIIWAHQIKIEPVSEKGVEVKDIEGYGFGKGYLKADNLWRYVLGLFDLLRNRKGMDIVLLSHVDVKRYDSPETEPYDRYRLKLHKRAAAMISEWVDVHLFCNYRTQVQKTDVGFKKEVKRGVGSGERIIFTEQRPAFDAKNRWGLPPEIYIGNDKTWAAFHQAMSEATGGRYVAPHNPAIDALINAPIAEPAFGPGVGNMAYNGPPEGHNMDGQPVNCSTRETDEDDIPF